MNGTLDETQTEIRDLATDIFGRIADTDRVARVEATPDGFDPGMWAALAEAGLLGVAVPEEHDGLGLGPIELSLVCEQLGRVVAPVPFVATTVAAALITDCGSAEQRQRWLPAVARGEAILAVAPPQCAIEVRRDGDSLTGQLVGVPWAHVANAVLVPVGDGVVLLDPRGRGVTSARGRTTAREVALELTLDSATVETVGDAGAARYLQLRWLAMLAAVQAGVTAAAVEITAAYTSAREQFGKPLSTFQSVSLKAADAYLDATAIQSVARQAAWALDTGGDASLAVLTAAWWAAEGGQHGVHLTQHLHGGMGADVTYPVHRYFLWGKQIELLLGGASALLAELGEALDAHPDAGDALVLT